jgi:hypothetical protein
MTAHAAAIERAFRVARAGKATDIVGLKAILKKEGHMTGHLDGLPALSKELQSIMAASSQPPASNSTRPISWRESSRVSLAWIGGAATKTGAPLRSTATLFPNYG